MGRGSPPAIRAAQNRKVTSKTWFTRELTSETPGCREIWMTFIAIRGALAENRIVVKYLAGVFGNREKHWPELG